MGEEVAAPGSDGRGAGVKVASVVGIVIGTIEILLFGFFLLMLASSTQ